MTALWGVAVYCFFAFKYPYHIHFQEQYQLFEFTWDYFLSISSVPGGLSDYLGRFLTQFFYYAPLGSVLMALLLGVVQLLSFCIVCKDRRSLPAYALSFLPSIALALFYCDENALGGAAVAIALALGAAALSFLGRKRFVLELVLVPIVYLICGPIALVYVLAVAIREGRKGLPWTCGMLLLLAISPYIASLLVPYPLGRLYTGVHYYRYHNIVPGLLWISAALSLVPALLSGVKLKKNLIPGICTYVLLAGLGCFLVLRSADNVKEEWMKYDFMVRMQMWNRIMYSADHRNPDNPKTVSCLNLALSKANRMADSQFEYYQNGPEGLIPEFRGDYTNPIATGEIFWHLGMVNTAQRYAFETQEAIPDFQKSARCYKRLAETNIVNGDWAVARKYLKALQNTLYYRKWADETLSLMDGNSIFEKREDLRSARDRRLREHSFLFSDTEMDSMLGLLKVEHPENRMALDYLMAWCLLRKDLDRFVQCIPLIDAPSMPKAYQEALLLRWVLTHSDFEGLPSYISPVHARRISSFISDFQANKSSEYMQKNYGDTYWFYYYFRYRSLNDLARDNEKNASDTYGRPYSGGL